MQDLFTYCICTDKLTLAVCGRVNGPSDHFTEESYEHLQGHLHRDHSLQLNKPIPTVAN